MTVLGVLYIYIFVCMCASFKNLPSDLDEAEICFPLCSVFIAVGLQSQSTTSQP